MRSQQRRKGGRSRRSERCRAFQALYGLSFGSVSSLTDLARRFSRALYAEAPSGAAEKEVLMLPEPDPGAGEGEKFSPGLDLLHAEDQDTAVIVTPEAGGKAEGFAWDLVRGVWINREKLDQLLADFSRNWRVDRMGRVELALLRLALQELFFETDTPPRVILNEALDLSGQFGDEASRAFVNGILDAAVRALETGALRRSCGLSLEAEQGGLKRNGIV